MLSVVILGVIMLNVVMLSVNMLNVAMLSVIMLNVIMLNVVMLSVLAPSLTHITYHLGLIFESKAGAYPSESPCGFSLTPQIKDQGNGIC